MVAALVRLAGCRGLHWSWMWCRRRYRFLRMGRSLRLLMFVGVVCGCVVGLCCCWSRWWCCGRREIWCVGIVVVVAMPRCVVVVVAWFRVECAVGCCWFWCGVRVGLYAVVVVLLGAGVCTGRWSWWLHGSVVVVVAVVWYLLVVWVVVVVVSCRLGFCSGGRSGLCGWYGMRGMTIPCVVVSGRLRRQLAVVLVFGFVCVGALCSSGRIAHFCLGLRVVVALVFGVVGAPPFVVRVVGGW